MPRKISIPLAISIFIFQPAAANSNSVPPDQLQHGEYIFHLGGCASCHTSDDAQPLAGGLKMETKFGDFYTPNITPDKKTGIGNWSDEDFIQAMTLGRSPEGQHYYPAFPYTSYTKMKRQDLIDLKRYLDTQPAIRKENKTHALKFPFNIRPLLQLWKLVNFEAKPFRKKAQKSPLWNRGAYIVNGPGHCTECHSPRNILGGVESAQHLSGNPQGPDGETVPGITQNKSHSISKWSEEDLIFFLQLGMLPDGDFTGGTMGHVIENTTSKLTEKDQKAIALYLKNLEG